MNTNRPRLVALLLMLSAISAFGTVHYVDANGTNATPPFLDWSTAATNIQDAVDATVAGDELIVTNGLYASGWRTEFGTSRCRVSITKPLTVRSVNGPQFTIIEGYQVPGVTNGNTAIRCAHLADGATLSGFTLTNGATVFLGSPANVDTGGGVWCDSTNTVVTNCVMAGNSAQAKGGGASGGTLIGCTLIANSTAYGGGAFGATLNNCTLIGNSAAYQGGGAYASTLNNCILSNNSARLSGGYGGGASDSTLINCTLNDNSADWGGGTYYGTLGNCTLSSNLATFGGGARFGTLNNCTLRGNLAFSSGGGASSATLNNSVLTGNSATNTASSRGGGADNSTLNDCILAGNWSAYQAGGASAGALKNCTLISNSARYGGGTIFATLNNCIVFYNTATIGSNFFPPYSFNNCCTTPKPNSGFGNITNSPAFIDLAGGDFRLQTNSPCINAGNNAYATNSTDLDGNPRIVSGTVDIGAYEYQGSGSLISYAWLQQYGLPTDGSADFTDPDGDRMNNWQEWRCLTDPTNALSVLRLLSAAPVGSNVTVSWQSAFGVNYFLERSTNLTASSFQSLATNLPGQTGTTTFTDTNAAGASANFYRVGVP